MTVDAVITIVDDELELELNLDLGIVFEDNGDWELTFLPEKWRRSVSGSIV